MALLRCPCVDGIGLWASAYTKSGQPASDGRSGPALSVAHRTVTSNCYRQPAFFAADVHQVSAIFQIHPNGVAIRTTGHPPFEVETLEVGGLFQQAAALVPLVSDRLVQLVQIPLEAFGLGQSGDRLEEVKFDSKKPKKVLVVQDEDWAPTPGDARDVRIKPTTVEFGGCLDFGVCNRGGW